MNKGVSCPNIECSERFIWDWCQDIWETVTDHENCQESIIVVSEDKEVSMYTCPSCGSVLSFLVYEKFTEKLGGEFYFFPNDEWLNADWEENSTEEPTVDYN